MSETVYRKQGCLQGSQTELSTRHLVFLLSAILPEASPNGLALLSPGGWVTARSVASG